MLASNIGKTTLNPEAQAICDFWVSIGPSGWFTKNDVADADISTRFGNLHGTVLSGGHTDWCADAPGSLAYVILLDQFSRNMFRNDPRAFAGDKLALEAAGNAVSRGYHLTVDAGLASFFFLPFMHAENIADQRRCVTLMHAHSGADSLKFALLHLRVIARFGRFPHRNAILGRISSHGEIRFLEAGGFAG